MSGGSYDYMYTKLNDLADMLDPQIMQDENLLIRRRTAAALRELSNQCHDIEWIESGDYGREKYKEIEEWLTKHNF